jgi:hypothetical protein
MLKLITEAPAQDGSDKETGQEPRYIVAWGLLTEMNCSVTGVVCDVMRDDAIAVLFRNDAPTHFSKSKYFSGYVEHKSNDKTVFIHLNPAQPGNVSRLSNGDDEVQILRL